MRFKNSKYARMELAAVALGAMIGLAQMSFAAPLCWPLPKSLSGNEDICRLPSAVHLPARRFADIHQIAAVDECEGIPT
jgi:hypothetical protein